MHYTEGSATDARAGALHLWCASESAGAIECARPLLRALAATAAIVGSDLRDVCSAQLARACAAGRHRIGGKANAANASAVSVLRASGSDSVAAVVAAAERRETALERQLQATRDAADDAAALQREVAVAAENADADRRDAAETVAVLHREVADAAERTLEADTRAVQAMESSATLRGELATVQGDLEDMVAACNLMDVQLRDALAALNNAKSSKLRLAEAEDELVAGRAAEEELGEELTRVQTVLAEEVQTHRMLRRTSAQAAATAAAALQAAGAKSERTAGEQQTRVVRLEAELAAQYGEVCSAREATEKAKAALEEERAAHSAAASSGWVLRSQSNDLQHRVEDLQGQLTSAAKDAEWYREAGTRLERAEELARQMVKNAEEACDQRDDARRELGNAYQEIERLDEVKVAFDIYRQQSEREAAAAGAAVEAATRGEAAAARRAESSEDDIRCLGEELIAAHAATAAVVAVKDLVMEEMIGTRDALVVAHAERDSDAALAYDSAEQAAAVSIEAADIARADAESRAQRCADQLVQATERADREANRSKMLSEELAASRDDAKLAHAAAANVATLSGELTTALQANTRLTAEVTRLEQVVVESYGLRNAAEAAGYATERARADTMVAEKARAAAEAVGSCAAAEVTKMADRVRHAEAARVAAEAAVERAQQELETERTAGATAHAALADIGAETARLAEEIDAARGMQAQWAAGKQATRDAVAMEEASRLHRALAAAKAGGGQVQLIPSQHCSDDQQ